MLIDHFGFCVNVWSLSHGRLAGNTIVARADSRTTWTTYNVSQLARDTLKKAFYSLN